MKREGDILISNLLGVYSRSSTSQRLDIICQDIAMAKVDVEADGVQRSLSAFSPILKEICGGIVRTLLVCELFSLMYTERNVINAISCLYLTCYLLLLFIITVTPHLLSWSLIIIVAYMVPALG